MFLWLGLLVLLAYAEAKVDYTGHRLVSIQAKNAVEVDFLRNLEENNDLQLDFWTEPSLVRSTDIHVPPGSYSRLRRSLQKAGIQFTVTKDNIQDLIDEEDRSMRARNTLDIGNSYLSYDQVTQYVYAMQSQYPNRVSVRGYGKTYEGRDLLEVKIASDLNKPKKAIYIEAGTHAREWITVSTALNLIKTLASGTADGESMLAKYDWFITPSHNPDGYEYSRTNDRMWRKNRQGVYSWWFQTCGGTDLNRNWDANYGGQGSSSDDCSDTYRGTGAFSAPETKALMEAVAQVRQSQDVVAFFSIHCYSQLMLVPYGYQNKKPSDYNQLKCVADKMMAALKAVDGRTFTVGTPPDLLYVASGGAYDYFYDTGIKYSYTYELRPAGSSEGGFVLPTSHILPAARETIASLKAFADMDLSSAC